MKPERARELAAEMRNEWMHNGYHDAVGKIAKIILQACAEQREEIVELYDAAQALRQHIDRRYNGDPRSCLIMNCAEQQRLWRAIDAAAIRKSDA